MQIAAAFLSHMGIFLDTPREVALTLTQAARPTGCFSSELLERQLVLTGCVLVFCGAAQRLHPRLFWERSAGQPRCGGKEAGENR